MYNTTNLSYKTPKAMCNEAHGDVKRTSEYYSNEKTRNC